MHSLASHMSMDFSRVSTRTMPWSRGVWPARAPNTSSDLGQRCQLVSRHRPTSSTQAAHPFRYTRNPFHETRGRCPKIVDISGILGLTHRPHEGGTGA